MRTALLLIASLVAPLPALAQSVTAQDGNLFYRASADAPPRQLTSSGLDRDPILSPDGQLVAFVRDTPGDSVEIVIGTEEATSLWTIHVDGSDARMRLKGRAGETAGESLAMLHGPQFSPDGARIYFLSAAWANSAAVHVLDLATGNERFLVAGNSLEVLPAGEYAGHLMVSQHRYFLAGGSYDWYWLVAPDGREIDPIGEDETALHEFRTMYVEP